MQSYRKGRHQLEKIAEDVTKKVIADVEEARDLTRSVAVEYMKILGFFEIKEERSVILFKVEIVYDEKSKIIYTTDEISYKGIEEEMFLELMKILTGGLEEKGYHCYFDNDTKRRAVTIYDRAD